MNDFLVCRVVVKNLPGRGDILVARQAYLRPAIFQIIVERDLFFIEEWIDDMLAVIERIEDAKKKKQAPSQEDER